MIKCLIFFGLGFFAGIFALLLIVYLMGKAEMKRLGKWE